MLKLNVETFPIGMLQTNCYVLWPENEKVCWVIDPGGPPAPVIKLIEKRNLDLQSIVITHGHFDHFMGNQALKEQYPNAKIAIHEVDADLLVNADVNLSTAFFGYSIVSPPADQILHEGDKLQLGSLTFTVIHTPGHCPGCICLHCDHPDVRTLFVGDLIFAGGGVGRTDFPGASGKELTKSISRIFKIVPEDTAVYPGHGPTTTIKREKQMLGYFE